MKNFPKKITSENFGEAAKAVLSASASIKKNKKTEKIVKPCGSILFVFLSFLFIYGGIYENIPADGLIIFEKLTPITAIWSFFAKMLIAPNGYMNAIILVIAAFAIPLAVSAMIKLFVSLTHKTDFKQFSDGGTAPNAKKLHSLAMDLSKNTPSEVKKSEKTPYKVIFALLMTATLIYASIVLNIVTVAIVIELLIFGFILFLVYGLIFNLFFTLNKLFYKQQPIPKITAVTEEYWLRVDSEEASRRAQQQKTTKKQAKPPRPTPPASAPSTPAIDPHDSFTWTNEYVRNNETKCSNVALSILKVSKEFLEEKNYRAAAAGFDKVVRALELLKNIDSEYYLPPLFANCYALCQIFAFGLNNKDAACKYAKKACDYASQCNSASAKRDLAVMQDLYHALLSASSIASITDEFDINFPYDILRMG